MYKSPFGSTAKLVTAEIPAMDEDVAAPPFVTLVHKGWGLPVPPVPQPATTVTVFGDAYPILYTKAG